jgi:enamine deaminase RidA (YjgF/YER057c/UK114 family)
VPVSLSQLRKAMYDLQMYDVCKQEVLVYDSISRAYEDKIKFQYEVIQLNYQVDSLRVSQLQDMRHINDLMKQKVDIVTTQVKRQKRITVGVGTLGLLGIILL